MLITDHAILPHIIEQHAEEAAFLWTLRDAATDAPHCRRRHLARLDRRVDAHVDGLRVAGETGWHIALTQLQARCEKGELFAAAILALESGDPQRIDRVLATAEAAPPDVRRGLLGAIAWCPSTLLAPSVRAWGQSASGFRRYLALCACSDRRAEPGPTLVAALNHPDPLPRARAFRLVGELGKRDYHATCLAHLRDPDAAFWAAWSAVLLGDREVALEEVTRYAASNGLDRTALEVAVRALGLGLGTSFVRTLAQDPQSQDIVALALGHLGNPTAVPWLITRTHDPQLARLAGESIMMITGVDLAFADLDRDKPSVADQPPAPDDSDETDDSLLPWPDPVRLQSWWRQAEARFTAGTRYLCGEPVDARGCSLAWADGFQRQRRAAAIEMKLAAPSTVLRNWKECCRDGAGP